jgi:hypothetical protein
MGELAVVVIWPPPYGSLTVHALPPMHALAPTPSPDNYSVASDGCGSGSKTVPWRLWGTWPLQQPCLLNVLLTPYCRFCVGK